MQPVAAITGPTGPKTDPFRIESMTMRTSGDQVCLSNFVVFVGANNVGKSRLLAEIVDQATQESPRLSRKVLGDLVLGPANKSSLLTTYPPFPVNELGPGVLQHLAPTLDSAFSHHFYGGPAWLQSLERDLEQGERNVVASAFGSRLIAYLTTESRLSMTRQGPSASDRGDQTFLQGFYSAGSAVESAISNEVFQGFGTHIALDFSTPQILRIRVGKSFEGVPPDPRDRKALMEEFELLDDQGDGVRSYAGIVAASRITDRPVFIIDEPEAFLHPPQAYRIGQYLAQVANRGRQVIVSTHSSDVLRGALSIKHDAQIVRLARQDDNNSAEVLSSDLVMDLTTDPLLGSARILEGLFYPGVVVTEADADARFFQAVHKSLGSAHDLHFVNVDNKAVVGKVVRAYRDVSVPAVGIVDIDALNDQTEFNQLVTHFGANSDEAVRLEGLRTSVARAIGEVNPAELLTNVLQHVQRASAAGATNQDASVRLRAVQAELRKALDNAKAWKKAKELGVMGLEEAPANDLLELVGMCDDLGLIVNEFGELESLLVNVGVDYTTDKRAWIRRALQMIPRLTPDPSTPPWSLMGRVLKHWSSPASVDT